MGIVSVLSTASPMSEADLRIIFSRLDTLRIMSEYVAEGLEEAVPALDEKLVHDMIVVLDALLRAFGEQGRAEFSRRFSEYLEIDDHTLIERAADAVNAKSEFYGISRGSIVETIRAACPDDQDDRRRYSAKLIFMRRIGELVVFGDNYAQRKRAHLRLV
jgi:hypothetical protein